MTDDLILRSDAVKAACDGASYSDIKKIKKNLNNVPAVHMKPKWEKCCEGPIMPDFGNITNAKTARWIRPNPLTDTFECSNCRYNVLADEFRTEFCPGCGSKMKLSYYTKEELDWCLNGDK